MSIRDSLHSQAEILRKQREVEFNKKINLLVSEQSSYLRGGYFLFGSPLWADIREHASSKERLKDYIQIFGHTMLSRPYFEDKIICLDCKKAFILENNEIKEF